MSARFPFDTGTFGTAAEDLEAAAAKMNEAFKQETSGTAEQLKETVQRFKEAMKQQEENESKNGKAPEGADK